MISLAILIVLCIFFYICVHFICSFWKNLNTNNNPIDNIMSLSFILIYTILNIFLLYQGFIATFTENYEI